MHSKNFLHSYHECGLKSFSTLIMSGQYKKSSMTKWQLHPRKNNSFLITQLISLTTVTLIISWPKLFDDKSFFGNKRIAFFFNFYRMMWSWILDCLSISSLKFVYLSNSTYINMRSVWPSLFCSWNHMVKYMSLRTTTNYT